MNSLKSSEANAAAAPLLLSIKEACRLLGVSRTTLYGELAAGRLRSVTVGRRRFIPCEAVEAFIAGLPTDYRRRA